MSKKRTKDPSIRTVYSWAAGGKLPRMLCMAFGQFGSESLPISRNAFKNFNVINCTSLLKDFVLTDQGHIAIYLAQVMLEFFRRRKLALEMLR
jgi:hypothetical protein